MTLPRSTRRNISREVLILRQTLKAFDRSLRRLTPLLSAGMASNGASMENGRGRLRLSARGRASLVLQGRYMGYMRQLKPRQKKRVRQVRLAKGVRAAIASARQLAREV